MDPARFLFRPRWVLVSVSSGPGSRTRVAPSSRLNLTRRQLIANDGRVRYLLNAVSPRADSQARNDIKLNYQSIRSDSGISAIQARTVDCSTSDAPLEPAELEAAGLVQWPQCVGGVVLVVNLDGVETDQLKLTAELVAKTHNGGIKDWSDLAIAATGDVWTLGGDKEVPWPTGVGGQGNEGVASSVRQFKRAIGYVEYAYAKETGLVTRQLQNADGEWVEPSLDAFSEAAAQADRAGADGFHLVLVDQPGPSTWPITGASLTMVPKEQENAAHAQTMLQHYERAFTDGGASAGSLYHVPVPQSACQLIESEWNGIIAAGTQVWPL